MQFSITFLLAALASGAAIQQRDGECATVKPWLAPGCVITGTVTDEVCPFPEMALQAGVCQDVTTDCIIHPPTSFFTQLTAPSLKRCYVGVFPAFGCQGNEVDSADLTTKKSNCQGALYAQNALTSGLLPGSSILPFGFKSVKLICV
ncbi:hypothetical protein LX36DRAFT_407437 [Colletotrichum falcatum]|nr:hypothetical protein LX36DRAFT_407437 [Colletotrichum falcatum]